MDTVKVDLQKLQLLNDRITQTIEALDQVRASVHGIQHSMGAGQQQVGLGQGWQQNESWQQRQGWPQGPRRGASASMPAPTHARHAPG